MSARASTSINSLELNRKSLLPEENLLIAVLDDAIGMLKLPPRKWRHQEAARWFWSEDARWPFSFVRICSHFDWSPEAVRSELNKLNLLREIDLP